MGEDGQPQIHDAALQSLTSGLVHGQGKAWLEGKLSAAYSHDLDRVGKVHV